MQVEPQVTVAGDLGVVIRLTPFGRRGDGNGNYWLLIGDWRQ